MTQPNQSSVAGRVCSVDNCEREVQSRGWCDMHYKRWRRTGDPLKKRPNIGNTFERSEKQRQSTTFHGHSTRSFESPTYRSWRAMKGRCLNPNDSKYDRYGGRGIIVCERWAGPHSFPVFLADMGERPDNTTLHRIDGNGNYEPENCVWATPAEQVAEQFSRKG